MKIEALPNGFRISYPNEGMVLVDFSEICTIDIDTLLTPVGDVNYVTMGHESGEFMEITDDAMGFQDFCGKLSEAFLIDPPILKRFPFDYETGISRVFQRP